MMKMKMRRKLFRKKKGEREVNSREKEKDPKSVVEEKPPTESNTEESIIRDKSVSVAEMAKRKKESDSDSEDSNTEPEESPQSRGRNRKRTDSIKSQVKDKAPSKRDESIESTVSRKRDDRGLPLDSRKSRNEQASTEQPATKANTSKSKARSKQSKTKQKRSSSGDESSDNGDSDDEKTDFVKRFKARK